jgi:hypothetical protein
MALKLSLILAMLAVVPGTTGESLRLSVNPTLSVQPAVVVVRVSIEPHEDNRAMRLVAESADYFRSSQVELDGQDAWRTTVFRYRDLPAGAYTITGTLLDPSGRERAEASSQLIVNP